ncbi:putative endonuclease 4 [Paenibacillus baekrokdamisoli]|uniref:Putative endonuclease 4 n=2 Tax=Paenibacillus baekrokdamisoli TaxID=1712516 RepID=A0A3G9ILS0_9BACL|nr:deoxyribonuclease IV [Paenibacillus baekrokdamisoli]BBH19897.1 putative endonuclease 4 [Paenibacillus baekrokdamisoli]
MRAGCHVSTKGGYAQAAKTAASLGAESFQYFPKNPRSLVVKSFDDGDAKRCAAFCQERGIASIAHSPYPTNIAAEDPQHRARTVVSLLNDLDIAEACGSLGVVVHFGVYKGPNPLEGYQNAIFTLNAVTSQWKGQAKLLIENQAGEHTFMGTTMEELAQIRSLADHPHQIGFCLDTCHLFASGVWDGSVDAQWVRRARELHVLEHLVAIHLNDSVYPSGAKKDRHAVIGEGYIGETGLKWLLNMPELVNLPFVLETSAGADGTHREQLALIREWGGSV